MPRRSIVITFHKDDPTVATDIQFFQRLNDLRERYPTWSIQGVVHSDDRGAVLPKRPQNNNVATVGGGGDGEAAITAWMVDTPSDPTMDATPTSKKKKKDRLAYHPERERVVDDETDSLESDGNVIGEPPRDVVEGLRVTFVVPPYEGNTGKVSLVEGERFRVTMPSGSTWWCTRDDVIVAAEGGDHSQDDSVAVTTMELNRKLQSRVKELEEQLSRLR